MEKSGYGYMHCLMESKLEKKSQNSKQFSYIFFVVTVGLEALLLWHVKSVYRNHFLFKMLGPKQLMFASIKYRSCYIGI